MNQLYNPFFLLKIIKTYMYDIDRLRRLNNEQLQKFKDKQFKKIINFADTVPMYHDLFKKNGVKIEQITGIKDITKLPIVSKNDFEKYYPEKITSSKKTKNNYVKVSTSGTTGKSLSIYVEMFDIIMGLFGYLRTTREYDINWRKQKLSIIGDFAPHTAESGYVNRGLMPNNRFNSILKNIQWLDTNDPPEKIINELNKFKPAFIGGYTGMLGHLAVLRNQGKGLEINPSVIASTGAPLASELKQFIEKTFNTKVFEVYGATETGPIAFQCKQSGIYHVMSDLLHLEFLNEKNDNVSSKQPGRLIVTKLYGHATPIIRYDALNDIVAPLYEKHDCGLAGDLINKIYGRDSKRLYRKDGKIILSVQLNSIFSKLLYELQTSKVRDLKVIQKSLDDFEIQVVIDEKLRNIGPSVEDIFNVYINGFKEKFGSSINVICKEVKNVSRDEPRIISKVDPTKIKITGFA
jgi:phenylacetate-CoA ligase